MTQKRKEEVRPLTPEEVPLLRRCLEGLATYHNRVARSFAGRYPIMPIDVHLSHMREHLVNGTALLVGLFFPDGRIRGFGMASYEGDYGEIDYLFIDKELRGDGRGDKIMERLLSFLDEKGVGFVDLKVVLGNPARRFYEKYGFRVRTEVMSRTLHGEEQ